MQDIKTVDIEIAVAKYFSYNRNIVVPNISYGLWMHECDLLVVTKAGFAFEVEIKVSKADIKKDLEKKHGHFDNRLKYLYFAIPEKLKDCVDLIPERAGIILVSEKDGWMKCTLERKPSKNTNVKKLTEKEQLKVAHLGSMRIWSLKDTIRNYYK